MAARQRGAPQCDPLRVNTLDGPGQRDRGSPVLQLLPDVDDLARFALAFTEVEVVERQDGQAGEPLGVRGELILGAREAMTHHHARNRGSRTGWTIQRRRATGARWSRRSTWSCSSSCLPCGTGPLRPLRCGRVHGCRASRGVARRRAVSRGWARRHEVPPSVRRRKGAWVPSAEGQWELRGGGRETHAMRQRAINTLPHDGLLPFSPLGDADDSSPPYEFLPNPRD